MRSKLVLFIVLAVLVMLAFLVGDPVGWLRSSIAVSERLGWMGVILFVAVYVGATVFMVPGSVLTLAAGTLFGVAKGTAIVSLASTLGAAAAFLASRFLVREAVLARVAAHPAFAALDRAAGEQGWKIVALARLSPVFPYTLLNYAFGLTAVRFGHYVLASWVGMFPGTLFFVYLGSVPRAGVEASERSMWEWALHAAGLMATLGVTLLVTRMSREALRASGLAGEPASAATEPSSNRLPKS